MFRSFSTIKLILIFQLLLLCGIQQQMYAGPTKEGNKTLGVGSPQAPRLFTPEEMGAARSDIVKKLGVLVSKVIIESKHPKTGEPIYLMIKRKQHPKGWEFPGGTTEAKDGHSSIRTAIREVGEEVGIEVGRLHAIDTAQCLVTYPENEKHREGCVTISQSFYFAEAGTWKLKLNEMGDWVGIQFKELESYRWCTQQDILLMMVKKPCPIVLEHDSFFVRFFLPFKKEFDESKNVRAQLELEKARTLHMEEQLDLMRRVFGTLNSLIEQRSTGERSASQECVQKFGSPHGGSSPQMAASPPAENRGSFSFMESDAPSRSPQMAVSPPAEPFPASVLPLPAAPLIPEWTSISHIPGVSPLALLNKQVESLSDRNIWAKMSLSDPNLSKSSDVFADEVISSDP